MSQQPVSERARLKTRAALWAAMRSLKRFTPKELRYETRCSRDQVAEYVKSLVASGHLERVAVGLYELVRDTGIEPPRVRRDGTPVTQGLGREQMWRTMKLLREFTAVDLAVASSTEETPVEHSSAQEYCQYLALAGYLTLARRGKGLGRGGVQALYRFVPSRNSGPLPPMIQRVKAVYDPNLETVVWDSEEGRHDQD